eukprot:jgi/Psemu1/9014/gm1.9014_g
MKFRCLFVTFRKNRFTYLQTQDFNEVAGFQAYWKNNVFKITKRYKADYGTCPNKARFDKDFSIVKEDFETGVFTEGKFVEVERIRLKPNYYGQKKRSLLLKNPVLDNWNTKKTTLLCPYNGDPMSMYQTTIKLLSLVPDNCKGNPEQCTAHGEGHGYISKVANAGVSASLVKGLGGHAHLNTTTDYILPDQQAVDAALQAKHGSPYKIHTPVPAPKPVPVRAPAVAPALAPAPPSPALSAEESRAPALFVDDSPAASVQHSVAGNHSNDSVPSDCAAGALGLTTQRFEVPNESPPSMPSNISFTTGEEPSPVPVPFSDQRCPRPTKTVVVCLLRIDRNTRIILASRDMIVLENSETRIAAFVHTMIAVAVDTRITVVDARITAVVMRITAVDMRIMASYKPRYKDRKPPPRHEARRLSFGETLSYKPRYEELRLLSNNKRKQHRQRDTIPVSRNTRNASWHRIPRRRVPLLPVLCPMSSAQLLLKEALKNVLLLLKTSVVSLLVTITITATSSRMAHGDHLQWKCFHITLAVLLAGYLLIPTTQKFKLLVLSAFFEEMWKGLKGERKFATSDQGDLMEKKSWF